MAPTLRTFLWKEGPSGGSMITSACCCTIPGLPSCVSIHWSISTKFKKKKRKKKTCTQNEIKTWQTICYNGLTDEFIKVQKKVRNQSKYLYLGVPGLIFNSGISDLGRVHKLDLIKELLPPYLLYYFSMYFKLWVKNVIFLLCIFLKSLYSVLRHCSTPSIVFTKLPEEHLYLLQCFQGPPNSLIYT